MTNSGWREQALDVVEGRARWVVLEGDCRHVLATFGAWSNLIVDVVLADPPYSEHVHSSVRSSGRNAHPDVAEQPCRTRRTVDLGFDCMTDEEMAHVSALFARCVKRWVAVFSDLESCHLWRSRLSAVGLDYVRTPVAYDPEGLEPTFGSAMWHRVAGAPQFSGDRPAVGIETITLAHPPGRKQWNGGGKSGVYVHPIVANRLGERGSRLHPTQKPLELMLDLVDDFTNEGDVVLDPYAGSGTTGEACLLRGRRVILVERSPKWAAVCRERMRAAETMSSVAMQRAGQEPLFGVR